MFVLKPPLQPIVDLNRRVSVAGIAAREGLTATRESAGKWRCNDVKRLNPGQEMELAPSALKRLNPGAEIVWHRKPPTYKIGYTGERLTGRDSG